EELLARREVRPDRAETRGMRTPGRTLAAAAALAAMAGTLTACGSDDDETQAAPVVLESPTATGDGTGDDAGTAGDGAADDAANSGVFDAIELAEAVAGGTAFEVDREDSPEGWEVSVAVDGAKVDVDVSLDGTEVLRT